MNFYSPIFLFLFFPLVLAGYWSLRAKWRACFLLFASVSFYVSYSIFYNSLGGGKGGGGFVLLLLYFCITNYFFGIAAARCRDSGRGRLLIWLSTASNLAPLLWYKYAGLIPLLASQPRQIPLGISFLSFQAIAYVLDVSSEQIEPQTNPVRFALFMTFFPKIAAGPILRYADVAADLAAPRLNRHQFSLGIKRFIVGLGKKVLLADTLAQTADQIFSLPASQLTAGVAWLGLLSYTLQLYLDFSGYSDMAIGLGGMFGISLPENFNYPYLSRSLTEFWRRWHISLSSWFRDYFFIPLSYALMTERVRRKMAQGKYRTNYRVVFSLIVVFSACGLWHGAGWNYLAWGVLHGVVLALESLWLSNALKKWWVPLQHAYLLAVVMLAWVFFREPTLRGALAYLCALAGLSGSQGMPGNLGMYLDGTVVPALIAGALASLPIARAVSEWLERRGYLAATAVCECTGLALVIFLSFCTVASSTFTPFLYQQF